MLTRRSFSGFGACAICGITELIAADVSAQGTQPAATPGVTRRILSQTDGPAPGYVTLLGRVDGFDQDEAESKRDERAVVLRRLLASKCDTLEAFELADRLFDACPCLVECFRKECGHILGVGSIRDCRTYSALARGVAI